MTELLSLTHSIRNFVVYMLPFYGLGISVAGIWEVLNKLLLNLIELISLIVQNEDWFM